MEQETEEAFNKRIQDHTNKCYDLLMKEGGQVIAATLNNLLLMLLTHTENPDKAFAQWMNKANLSYKEKREMIVAMSKLIPDSQETISS